MKRAALPVVVVAMLALAFILWPRDRPIVLELRALPGVASVEAHGTGKSGLVVVHIRDWHFIPEDFAKLEGIDHGEHLVDVEAVQVDQLAILRQLIKAHGTREIFIEGLSEESAPDFRLRVELLRTFAKAEDAGVLDAEGKAIQCLTRLEAGAVGRLLERARLITRSLWRAMRRYRRLYPSRRGRSFSTPKRSRNGTAPWLDSCPLKGWR